MSGLGLKTSSGVMHCAAFPGLLLLTDIALHPAVGLMVQSFALRSHAYMHHIYHRRCNEKASCFVCLISLRTAGTCHLGLYPNTSNNFSTYFYLVPKMHASPSVLATDRDAELLGPFRP